MGVVRCLGQSPKKNVFLHLPLLRYINRNGATSISIGTFYETLCTEISQAALVEFKDWAIIYCTLSIIPILWPAVIFGEQIGLDLGWILADFPAVFF